MRVHNLRQITCCLITPLSTTNRFTILQLYSFFIFANPSPLHFLDRRSLLSGPPLSHDIVFSDIFSNFPSFILPCCPNNHTTLFIILPIILSLCPIYSFFNNVSHPIFSTRIAPSSHIIQLFSLHHCVIPPYVLLSRRYRLTF